VITIIPETGRISPMFDAALHAAVLVCPHCGEESVETVAELPAGVAGKIEFLRRSGASLLVTGAISEQDMETLRELGIAVCPFVSGNWREVWAQWRRCNRLAPCHVMPGCRAYHRKCCKNNFSNERKKIS